MNKANPDNAHNTFIKLYKSAYNIAFPKTEIMCQRAMHKMGTMDDFRLLKIITNKKLFGKKLLIIYQTSKSI